MTETSASKEDSSAPSLVGAILLPPILFFAIARHYFHVQGLDRHASGPDIGADLFQPLVAFLFGTLGASFVGLLFAVVSRRRQRRGITTGIAWLYGLLFAASSGIILHFAADAHQPPWRLYVLQPNNWDEERNPAVHYPNGSRPK